MLPILKNLLELPGVYGMIAHGRPWSTMDFEGRVAMSLSVRAVERALDILLSFNDEEPARSLTQIAESVNLSKPTAHRLLATLEKKQFIAKDKLNGRYRLHVQLHGQPADPNSAAFAQGADRLEKNDSDRNALVSFAAAAIPTTTHKARHAPMDSIGSA
jgi:hypothetical protein